MRIEMVFFLTVFLAGGVLAVDGVSPGSYSVDFSQKGDFGEPGSGLEREFVFDFSLDSEEELKVRGDLAEYVELDKEEIRYRDSVVVTLKLPEALESYGVNNIWILAGGAGGVIKINVPYPDRYVDLKLFVPNVNFGDSVLGKLRVANFGKEALMVSPVVEIYRKSEVREQEIKMELVDRMFGEEKFFEVDYEKEYEISFDVLNLSVGDYLAVVNFEDFNYTDEFRIGERGIDILNYTGEVVEGLSKFEVEIENLGGDKFKEVYVEVRVLDGENLGFDSSIVGLAGWEKRKLVGYFDSEGLDGDVSLSLDVHYDGEVESGVVNVYVKERVGWIPWTGLGIVLIFLIVWFWFRSK